MGVLVRTFEHAGCSFQKFGQLISMRPDMFPSDVVEAFSNLRDDIPQHDFEHTKKMIKESFGHDIDEIFLEFDMTPVASGTVAQVHRARLRPEYASQALMVDKHGKAVQDVAVKVRHPHVLDETWLDVDLIYGAVQHFSLFSEFTMPFKQDEFLHQLQTQVDFEIEAHNLRKFAQNFKEEVLDGELWFPTVSETS